MSIWMEIDGQVVVGPNPAVDPLDALREGIPTGSEIPPTVHKYKGAYSVYGSLRDMEAEDLPELVVWFAQALGQIGDVQSAYLDVHTRERDEWIPVRYRVHWQDGRLQLYVPEFYQEPARLWDLKALQARRDRWLRDLGIEPESPA